jgi:hypothetical protein
MLKIQNIKELPDIGSRTVWARLLGLSRRGLLNAEKRGQLIVHRLDKRNYWYTKRSILDYLGITDQVIRSLEDQEDLPAPYTNSTALEGVLE